RTGLWGRLFPEWGAVRDLPPRDVVHIWTVDRHLAETVSRARIFTTRVARSDLLILAALLHDIGKGRHPAGPQRSTDHRRGVRGAGRRSGAAGRAACADRGRLAGHRAGGVE